MQRAIRGGGRAGARLLPALLALTILLAPRPLAAQLRPLEPVDWEDLAPDRTLSVTVGAGIYGDQPASLAGVRGRLLELGTFRGTWRMGRAAVQAAGTAYRVFRDDAAFATPVGATAGLASGGDPRTDIGDYRLSTLIRLDDDGGAWDTVLRFGVRLPTTDDRAGLERDRTDFFTTAGFRWRRDAVSLAGEAGVGILGTRDGSNEQVDPILFAARGELDLGAARPGFSLTGQHDTRGGRALRGNEDLGEARAYLTVGEGWWLRAGVARGWQTFSPGWGLTVETGIRW